MSSRPLLALIPIATLLVAALASAAPTVKKTATSAPKVSPTATSTFDPPAKAPPSALNTTQRSAGIKKTLDGIPSLSIDKRTALEDAVASAPAKLEMRLTALTPKLDNGAVLRSVEGTNFSSTGDEGLHYLHGASAGGSWVKMKFPTEVNEVYVVDCRALEYDWMWQSPLFRDGEMRLKVDGGEFQAITTVDGHLLWAFKAKQTTSKVELFYWGSGGDSRFMAWWGCDFGKAS